MGHMEPRQAVDAYAKALESGDVDKLKELMEDFVREDFVQEWPQSGERIRGKANAMAIVENYPGLPKMHVRNQRASGDLWVLELDLDYGQGPLHGVTLLEFEDGMLARQTDYFAEPFEAPEWRSKWVERM